MPVAGVTSEFHRAGSAVAERYSTKIQHAALESNWPLNLAERLGVRFTDEGQFAVSVDGGEEIPDSIMDQEFGTAERGPNSVIGNFFQDERNRRSMRSDLNRQLLGFVQSFDNALRGK